MLESPRHVKAMTNVGVGPPFPLFEKKMFYSLALSKKLSLIHGDFLTYQDVLHVARDILGSLRSFLFTFKNNFFFKVY